MSTSDASGAPVVPGAERTQFGSGLQFLLSCIGYAVGLGNLWRFPSLAFENGGGAFLVPYLTCSFLIGFPVLYLELCLGQYAKAGPAVVYGRIRPYAHGIGWGMAIMALLVSCYYNVILAWILIFLFSIVRGQSASWSTCSNFWNDENCVSSIENRACEQQLSDAKAFYFNGTCHFESEMSALAGALQFNKSATEQFFENYVLQKSASMEEFGGLNLSVVAALALAWFLTFLALFKGVKVMGKIAYFTSTVPYVIIAILFVRSVTLEGARVGLDFYLLDVDFSKALRPSAWQKAATQVCYSLAIGFGGLLSLSSYNPPHHNCFRDAMVITFADGFMSVFGGTAVFSALGFMATQQHKGIEEVVASGTGLAFVAYPEAMNQITIVPWLWALLFFVMLFILGISSQFGLAEGLCTALCDSVPSLRRHKGFVVAGTCAALFLMGLVMTSHAGIYYFTIFNDYSASFALAILILLELVLVCHVYGSRRFVTDLRTMFGRPRNRFTAFFGPTGLYFRIIWAYVAPVAIALLIVIMVKDQIVTPPMYGTGTSAQVLPAWSLGLGWLLSALPLFALPLMFCYQVAKFKKRHQLLKPAMTRTQPKWPSAWRDETAVANGISHLPTKETNGTEPSLHRIRPIEITSPPSAWNTVTAAPARCMY